MTIEDVNLQGGADPELHFSASRPEAPKKPRKKRVTKKKEPERVLLDVPFLAKQISSLHVAISIMLQDARWMISEEESEMLSTALQHASEAYDITIDPRWAACMELVGVCAMIYVPRVMFRPEPPKQQEPTLRTVQ